MRRKRKIRNKGRVENQEQENKRHIMEERKTSDGNVYAYTKQTDEEKKLAKEETIVIKNKIITDRYEREREENRRLALRLIVVETKPCPPSSCC